MTDWDAVREHLALIVMAWIHESPSPWWFDAWGESQMLYSLWQPDIHSGQFFMVKDAMRERGWAWHGWEDESGANVEYWKPGEFHVEYGEDLMQANALAAAEATGYGQE